MINQVTLVGRLVKTPDLFVTENGKKGTFITLAVGRPFKNVNGEYDTDFLDCTLWTGIAESTAEYCQKGDVIGVRGRLQTRIIDNDDGTKVKKMEIVADKVTFLSSVNRNDINSHDDEILVQEVLNEDEEESDTSKEKNGKNKK